MERTAYCGRTRTFFPELQCGHLQLMRDAYHMLHHTLHAAYIGK